MWFRLAVPLLATLFAAAPGSAGPVTSATPVYHGILDILAARGNFDPDTGEAKLRVRRWRLLLSPDSDGIFPDQEPTLIAIAENNFYLSPGAVQASSSGKRFRYRAPRDAGPRAINSLRLTRRRDGSYLVSFTLTGVELSRLTIANRDCVPFAFIVGDDDGFSGARLRRPNFDSRRLFLPGACDESGDWPWIQ
jgi:hypothetical protein